MKKYYKIIILVFIVILFNLYFVKADIPINSCIDLVSGNNYYLTDDINVYSEQICIDVYRVENIIIDGNGHSIIYYGSNPHAIAIDNVEGNNITIKNINFYNFPYAITVSRKDNIKILNNNFFNSIVDLTMFDSSYNLIYNNHFSKEIYLYFIHNSLIKNNLFLNTYFQIEDSTKIRLINNIFKMGGINFIRLDDSEITDNLFYETIIIFSGGINTIFKNNKYQSNKN